MRLGAFAVPVVDLPAYSPHLKGGVEQGRQTHVLRFLPGYTAGPRLKGGRKPAGEQRLLPLEAFITLLGQWVAWWNTEHRPCSLAGRTPAAAWEADLTPVEDAEPGALHMFTLEDDESHTPQPLSRWACSC